MIDWLEAIILGIIQGLTEFLPVSSSGHLELGKEILGLDIDPDRSLLFTVVLHFATALATFVVFRRDIFDIFKGLFQFKWNDETKFSLKIVLSMIPAVFVGLFFKDFIETLFDGQILLVGCMLLVTAVLLFLADKAKNTTKDVSFLSSVIIGISQAIAIMPGISRSGATISTSVLLGIDRTKAAKFSFIMVIPLIFGEMAKDTMEGAFSTNSVDLVPLILGFIASFITGFFACKWMIALVKKSKLTYFSIYCVIVSIIAIIYAI